MRIIAGSRKGHTIHAPRGRDTRPTSDRVRENVFNIVGPVDGATVLDLYAGSGAMGLEALSRGAAKAVFVERDADALRAIERNLDFSVGEDHASSSPVGQAEASADRGTQTRHLPEADSLGSSTRA